MTTEHSFSPALQKLSVSLRKDIDEFVVNVDGRASQKLFAQAKTMLENYERQRAIVFDNNTTNDFGAKNTLSALVKLAGRQTAVLRMIRRYDAENDQVNLAKQLIVDLTILTLIMNGDGVDAMPIYKNGVFYTFTHIERPAQPLREIFVNYMISFVRPLHSTDAPPEWEACRIDVDWEKIVQEIGWQEFIETE